MTGRILRTLRRIAETITAAMVAALFFSVVYQVFTRYILEAPAGWTMEFASILWLWIIFFAGALLVPDEEQIRIDVLYLAVPLWLRKIFALSAVAIILFALGIAFVPTLEFVQFMRIDYSPILRIGYDGIFAVFLLFMACAMIRAAIVLAKVARGRTPEDPLA